MKKRIRAFGNISKIRIVTRKTGDRFGFESDRLEIRERILSEANLRTCDTEILTIITRKCIIQDQSSHSTK
ncbi:unnamed protein product [Rhizophagus irregularis]|nr:unnamed protein product [Rhizophagus irregularis]